MSLRLTRSAGSAEELPVLHEQLRRFRRGTERCPVRAIGTGMIATARQGNGEQSLQLGHVVLPFEQGFYTAGRFGEGALLNQLLDRGEFLLRYLTHRGLGAWGPVSMTLAFGAIVAVLG